MLLDFGYAQYINDSINSLLLQNNHTSPQVFWDYCKNYLKEITIVYCKALNKKRINKLKAIQIQLEKYSRLLIDIPDNNELINKLNIVKI